MECLVTRFIVIILREFGVNPPRIKVISVKVMEMDDKDKSKAQDNLDDWGSTDDKTFLFDDKDEKVEDILWVSTNEDESNDDDEEDDESVDIEKTDDEKTDIDVEDHVIGVA
ncbi:hypothetical protein Tco_1531176 [Tanacetum coccineum]